MMLVELGTVPSAALPITEFRNHLNLGGGFADDAAQDELLEAYLRSAISTIEMRIGKAIFRRAFSWTVTRWSECARVGLPVGPVALISSLKLVTADGGETLIDPARYVLVKDSQRPGIASTGATLPSIPSSGHAEIGFEAGYGPAWSDVPAALRHGVFLQASHFFECRTGNGKQKEIPVGVMALIEGYRPMRLGGSYL